jgi:hypothetical protein
MFSRIFIVNVCLAILVILLGVKTYGVWFPSDDKVSKDTTDQTPASWTERKITPRMNPPEPSFRAVVDKNLFSPRREWREPQKQEVEPEPEPVIPQLNVPGKKIILHGVVVTEGYHRALVNNPTPGEKDIMWVKVGDLVGDFKVSEIREDRIIVAEGAKRYEVLLYDKDKPRNQGFATVDPGPTVVSTGSKPTVIKAKDKRGQAKPRVAKPKELPEEEYEMVRTPFGMRKRRKR